MKTIKILALATILLSACRPGNSNSDNTKDTIYTHLKEMGLNGKVKEYSTSTLLEQLYNSDGSEATGNVNLNEQFYKFLKNGNIDSIFYNKTKDGKWFKHIKYLYTDDEHIGYVSYMQKPNINNEYVNTYYKKKWLGDKSYSYHTYTFEEYADTTDKPEEEYKYFLDNNYKISAYTKRTIGKNTGMKTEYKNAGDTIVEVNTNEASNSVWTIKHIIEKTDDHGNATLLKTIYETPDGKGIGFTKRSYTYYE